MSESIERAELRQKLIGSFVLAGIFGSLFLGGATYGAHFYYHTVRTQTWPETDGQVVETSVELHQGSTRTESPESESSWYEPIVRYTYSVEGEQHTNDRISLYQPRSSTEQESRRFLSERGYRVGEAVKVIYDPQRPQASMLERPSDERVAAEYHALVVITPICLLIALFGVLRAVLTYRKLSKMTARTG